MSAGAVGNPGAGIADGFTSRDDAGLDDRQGKGDDTGGAFVGAAAIKADAGAGQVEVIGGTQQDAAGGS